jgi:hypothetical protein
MSCLAFLTGGSTAKPLAFVQEEQAGVEAACKLMGNFENVVQDICNVGSLGLGGGALTQSELERVNPKDIAHVRAMVKALCCRLLGKQAPDVSTMDEALVWKNAAKFLGQRLQGSGVECPGRAPDMSLAAATAMRKALGQMEAGYKLLSNRDRVINDITNPAPKTQLELKRVDSRNKGLVEAMVSEVSNRLLSGATNANSLPRARDQALVWAHAARFLVARIQGPADAPDNPSGYTDRRADMTTSAAIALRAALGQVEAAVLLMTNHETVVNDIANPGPNAIKGGAMTQLDLKRVESKHKPSVDKMVRAVEARLLGSGATPPSKEEAMVWVQAATFLSKRIQGSSDECAGRDADMSRNAAKELRAVLAQFEAGSKLTSNFENVTKDITNTGPQAVLGGNKTQLNLKRVDSKDKAVVDAMMREVCNRLFGKTISAPSTAAEAAVWKQAARFFNGRIQGLAQECPGRDADMSLGAAEAMREVLAKVPNLTTAASTTAAGLEAAIKQM